MASGELELIRQIRGRALQAGKSGRGQRSALPGRGALRLGIGDDCAVIRPPAGHDLLVTTDFSLEGRHFRREWHPAASVGHRCLARGLSDLAAMGAKPLAAFLSLALPSGSMKTGAGRRWAQGFFDGLFALAEATGTPLAGGDTAAAPGGAILADIVLLGSAPRGTELRRSGALPGDGIYVTGAAGGSAAELALLSASPRTFARATVKEPHPHLFPQPRLRAGDRLRRTGMATACIDVSDGISTDLLHLCEESRVGALLEADLLPVPPLLRTATREERLQAALHGGEDYELLFTARPGARVPRTLSGLAVTRIGTVEAGRRLRIRSGGRTRSLKPGGWEHTL